MENTTQQPKTPAPATVIDILTVSLPEAKFPAKPTADGRTSTLHTLATHKGVGARLRSDKFTYRSATDTTPALMHNFVNGLVNVHLYDELDSKLVLDGKAPVDVEIAAIIVRNKDGRIVDHHVYMNIRPSTSTASPTEVVTVHHVNDIPKQQPGTIYCGRRSAIAVRPVTQN